MLHQITNALVKPNSSKQVDSSGVSNDIFISIAIYMVSFQPSSCASFNEVMLAEAAPFTVNWANRQGQAYGEESE